MQPHQVEYTVDQLSQSQGFLREVRRTHAHGPDGVFQGGLPRHQHHGKTRIDGLHLVDDIEAIHPVHVDIRDDQIQLRPLGILQQFHGLPAFGKGVHSHAMVNQCIADHAEHGLIVINHQHMRNSGTFHPNSRNLEP